MKKLIKISSIVLLVLTIPFFFVACDSGSEQTTYSGDVQGIVIDSVLGIRLQNVEVTVYPGGLKAITDSNGYYFVGKIYIPRSEFCCTMNVIRVDYISKEFSFCMKHNRINTLDTIKLVSIVK